MSEPDTPVATCLDCGIPYKSFGVDVTLPDDQWQLIHPDKDGLLCGTCIARRAQKLDCVVALRAKLELRNEPPSKYKRPDDLPGRVCRVLEGLTLLKMSEDQFEGMVYRFCHIASGRCPHSDWMDEFVEMELTIEEQAYTSPAERTQRRLSRTRRG